MDMTKLLLITLCPMPYALCPMLSALCPLRHALCPLPSALCLPGRLELRSLTADGN
jgi:hypothetical protein